MLKKGWFVEGSIEQTVKNLIAAADKECVKRFSTDEFRRHLVNEVRMISAYDPKEEVKVEKYINSHAEELYAFARSLASKKNQKAQAASR